MWLPRVVDSGDKGVGEDMIELIRLWLNVPGELIRLWLKARRVRKSGGVPCYRCSEPIQYKSVNYVAEGEEFGSIYGPMGSYWLSLQACLACGWYSGLYHDTHGGGNQIRQANAKWAWENEKEGRLSGEGVKWTG